ncbi:MAG: hypothetical protein HOV68_24705, partial [Streptomycetaceae bacterium]|nr:hypothetical protein [Streptomycetaceae bacterium]
MSRDEAQEQRTNGDAKTPEPTTPAQPAEGTNEVGDNTERESAADAGAQRRDTPDEPGSDAASPDSTPHHPARDISPAPLLATEQGWVPGILTGRAERSGAEGGGSGATSSGGAGSANPHATSRAATDRPSTAAFFADRRSADTPSSASAA